MVEVFDELYSEYYDLIYKSKDYSKESRFVFDQIKKHSSIKVDSLLELGCGTGGHAIHWLNEVESWTGVDQSSAMLGQCKTNLSKFQSKIHLVESDINELSLNKKFDAVVSLFHVASYQETNQKLDKFFKIASEHLNEGGSFSFDFWHGAAVLSDRPLPKLLEVKNDYVKVTRFTNSKMLFSENIVQVEFKVWIDSIKKSERKELSETHRMRYLFATEILYFAAKYGLKLVSLSKWQSDDPLDDKAWYGFAVLTK